VDLTLAAGGGFDITYSLSTGQSTTGRDNLSGDILSDVKVNQAGQVDSFRLTGGRISHSDTNLALSIPPYYQVKVLTHSVATLPMTEGDGGQVDPATGLASNTGHHLISNEGTITTQYYAFTVMVKHDVRDLSTDPEDNALTGTTTLAATLVNSTGWWKRMKIDLSHQQDDSTTSPVDSQGVLPASTTSTLREKGSFTASGSGLFPGDDFIAWSTAHFGVQPEDLAATDPQTGQPLLVMYALRADPGAWPHVVQFLPTSGKLVLHLPSDGLQAPLKWEYWSGAAADSWIALPGTPAADGVTPAGAAGDTQVALPAGTHGFVRVSVSLPAP